MKQQSVVKDGLLISFSFIVALILTIFPLPDWAVWYRPAWVFLVLLYWLISVPDRVGIVVAWFVGLTLDLILGTVLGLNALLFTLLSYFMLKFHLFIRGLSSGHKVLLVMIIETMLLTAQYLVNPHENLVSNLWHYWMPIFTTTFCWVWVWILLKDYQYRFRIK
jgi:rod shape-determining protein MreD